MYEINNNMDCFEQKTRRNRIQMKKAKEEENFQKQYNFWKTMSFPFRLASFKTIKELEKDRKDKSITYRVLEKLTE